MVSRLINGLKYLLFDVHNGWEMGFMSTPIEKVISNKKLGDIHWLKTPKNTIWADPFGLKVDNHYYVYYEEKYQGEYGVVNCMVLDDKLNMITNKTIIDEGVHFSFPNVFEFDHSYYMLPETYEKGRLSLYECLEFPFEWKEEVIILNEPCVDSSLFFYEGMWFLLYCKLGHENNLFLKINSKLKEGWGEVDEVLVNQDPFNSQNGGRIIDINGNLFRVSQNCSKIYGESIVVNAIDQLSNESYNESIFHEFKLKSKTVSCCHTLNSCGDITLIDRRRERYYLKSPKGILSDLLKKLKG